MVSHSPTYIQVSPILLASLLEEMWRCWTPPAYIVDLQKSHQLLENVFCFISDITGILTSPEPSLVILNLGIGRFPPFFHSIVTHVPLAARLLIAKGWKSDKAPNLSEAVEIVCLHYKYKSMLATKQDTRMLPM